LKSPLCAKLQNAKKLFTLALDSIMFVSMREMLFLKSEDQKELPAEYYVQRTRGLQGQSQMREVVLEKVNSRGLIRPIHSLHVS